MALRSRLLTFFLLFIISCVLIAACNGTIRSASTHYDEPPRTNQQTRIIKHALGEVEVPLNPQRIVTINPVTLEAALALGTKPIGGSHWDWNQPYLQGKVDNVQDVGWIPHVNLEKVAALNPDFIIGSAYQQSIYNLLSQIAPTFLAEEPHQSNFNWEETFMHIAEGLDKTEIAAQVIANYHTRLEEFKQKRGDRREEIRVSVAALYQGDIGAYSRNSFPGSILENAGLSRPPSQIQQGRSSISKERLGDLDGDALFLINNLTDADSQKTLQQLRTDPLWAKLNVVQNDRVFEVGDYWLCCGPLAANAVIDDLFKYLVNTP